MKKILVLFSVSVLLFSCKDTKPKNDNVITSDIDLFWSAYDKVIKESDTLKQIQIIQNDYINKGSVGLEKIIELRDYTADSYVELINRYPKYWNSVRNNTLKAKNLADQLNNGVAKFNEIYPKMKPANIYFTIGAMRTNGTTQDSLVLIGSELAMADTKTDISEFEGRTKEWLETFFGANPLKGLVLLNVHEFVHTQQTNPPAILLYQVLSEGIAEFVSVKAMDLPSDAPAIEFGKNNPKVREKFEKEMFYNQSYDWLWSNSPNEFKVRDLGYYIGYSIAENHYERAKDKTKAIETLIELDYSNQEKIDTFIDSTAFFSQHISKLRTDFEKQQPTVIGFEPFQNGSESVSIKTRQFTVQFSESMIHQTNFEYGPLGEDAVIRYKKEIGYSENDTKYSFEIEDLKPNKRYQIVIGSGFESKNGFPLKPYLIDFKTKVRE